MIFIENSAPEVVTCVDELVDINEKPTNQNYRISINQIKNNNKGLNFLIQFFVD